MQRKRHDAHFWHRQPAGAKCLLEEEAVPSAYGSQNPWCIYEVREGNSSTADPRAFRPHCYHQTIIEEHIHVEVVERVGAGRRKQAPSTRSRLRSRSSENC